MPTPHTGYQLNGKSIPSVTTVIGRFDDKENLMAWAWRCGKAGLDYKVDGKRAATAGSAAHEAIETALLNQPSRMDKLTSDYVLDAEQIEWVNSCMTAFNAWRTDAVPNIEEMEVHYISQQYLYGGTPDAIGKVRGNRDLLDWKTSSGLTKSYLIQGAAYVHMWEESNGQKLDGLTIVRFDKHTGKYEEHRTSRQALDPYFQEFVVSLNLYDIKKRNGTLHYKKL